VEKFRGNQKKEEKPRKDKSVVRVSGREQQSFCFVILNQLLGWEESLLADIEVQSGKVAFIVIRPMKPRDSSLRSE